MHCSGIIRFSFVATALWFAPAQMSAQPNGSSEQQQNAPASEGFWNRDTLTGDWGGLRKNLEQYGLTFGLSYFGEILSNRSGGIKRGTIYEQEVLATLDADFAKLLGWQGASFHASAYDYAGMGLTQGYVGSLATVSSIEAPPPSVRLFTLWVNQNLLDDRLALKAGLLAMDEEQFTITRPGELFVGATFGYPDGIALNLPGGGPIYPLSAPAVLVEGKPSPLLDLRVAVFSGDPTGHSGATFPPPGIPPGTTISFSGGALIVAEAAVTPHAAENGVATRFRLGGWYQTSHHFADQHFATNGLSLADPASTGVPRNDIGDWALYGTAETMLYRVPGTKDQGLAMFARLAGLPSAQNQVSIYTDGGLTYKGLLPQRPEDTAGTAVAYLGVSPAVQALDADTRRFTGNPAFPIRSNEILLEATYQAQVSPWWILQPVVQYWFRPGGGVLNSDGQPRQNATVIGLRMRLQL